MTELRHLCTVQIYLILGLLVFLFGRTLYSELDVDGEMARGALPGNLGTPWLCSLASPPMLWVVAHVMRACLSEFVQVSSQQHAKMSYWLCTH